MSGLPWYFDVPLKETAPKLCSDYCMTIGQLKELTPVSEAMKFGYIMLIIGIVIGFIMPRVGVWIRDHIMAKDKD
jgi:hypothetical protein